MATKRWGKYKKALLILLDDEQYEYVHLASKDRRVSKSMLIRHMFPRFWKSELVSIKKRGIRQYGKTVSRID